MGENISGSTGLSQTAFGPIRLGPEQIVGWVGGWIGKQGSGWAEMVAGRRMQARHQMARRCSSLENSNGHKAEVKVMLAVPDEIRSLNGRKTATKNAAGYDGVAGIE